MYETDLMREQINDAVKSGADHAEIFVQSGVGHSVYYENGRIEELSSSNSDGSGARIIVGGRTFYASAPGAAAADIASAFSAASETAFGRKTVSCGEGGKSQPLSAVKVSRPDPSFISGLDKLVRGESSYVRQVSFKCSTSSRSVLVISPQGKSARDARNYTSFTAQVIVEKDGVLQTGSERRCMSLPYEKFWLDAKPEEIAMTALRRALLMLAAKPCPAGRMNVLLAGEAGGTIVHEACGHSLEADIVKKDYSAYRGKIGEKVADDSVTMVDDPTLPDLFGSYKFDDEGTPAQRTVLIENGVLKNYLTDINSALADGLPLSGNGRRESYRNVPVPRMSNTFLLPGRCEFDEMLSKAGSGLFVKKMGGGEVNPTSGDFVFYVSEGYLIRNGKIGEAVRGATLTGNGPSALRNIKALGHNLLMDPGICGKSGQGVPVTDGQPSMLVAGLTVGGSEA